MKRLTLLCISPLVLANVAMAGGMNTPAYAQGKPHHHHQKIHHFTGFGITGGLGGIAAELDVKQNFDGESFAGDDAHGDVDPFGFSVDDEVTYSDNLELFEANIAGLIGLEYNYQFDNGLVLGLAATAGFNNVEYSNTINVFDNPFVDDSYAGDTFEAFSNVSTTVKAELENDFAILFRPGFVVRENTMIYALVGPRWGNFETKLKSSYNNNGTADVANGCFIPGCDIGAWDETLSASSSNSEYELGITAGVGIRQVLANHFMLGLEYAYTHYGDLDSLQNVAVLPPTSSTVGDNTAVDVAMDFVANAQDMIVNTHTVMGTLTYKF